MKQITLLILFFFLISACTTNTASINTPDFNFLIGKWVRTNEKTDRSTYEYWKKLDQNTFLGCGFTIKDNDTIWQEHTILTKTNGKWFLKVKMNKKENQTTDFELIHFEKNSFTLENKENDFPKIITYFKEGNQLKAEISNDDSNKILFDFEKLKK